MVAYHNGDCSVLELVNRLSYNIENPQSAAGYAGVAQRNYICSVCRNDVAGRNLKACSLYKKPLLNELNKIFARYHWEYVNHIIAVLEALESEDMKTIAENARKQMFFETARIIPWYGDIPGRESQEVECHFEKYAKDYYCLSCRVGKIGVRYMEETYHRKSMG
jgi:hypothetical protein